MRESSETNLLANSARKDTVPDTLTLGVDGSYDLALRFWREAKYGAARAMVWPFTRPKNAHSVDVVVCMTNFLAIIDWSEQEYDRATRTLASVSGLVATLDDRVLQGKYFGSCAMCEQQAGRFGAAFGYLRDALDCYTIAGAVRYADDVENNIAVVRIQQGRPDLADQHITKALRSCDDPLTLAQLLDTRAKQETAFGHFDEARQLNRESIAIVCNLEQSGQSVANLLAEFARTSHAIDVAEVALMERTFVGVIQNRN